MKRGQFKAMHCIQLNEAGSVSDTAFTVTEKKINKNKIIVFVM